MKYVIIAALVSIVFVLIYARVRPYLKLVRQIVQSLTAVTDTTVSRQDTRSENKLVRCESCGTWVPADRALKLKSGLATFCSTECMTKKSESKERRIAG